MKKVITLLIGLLLVGSAVAVVLSDRQITMNEFFNYKNLRETQIDQTDIDIHFLSDYECVVDYYFEDIGCGVEIAYNMSGNMSIEYVGLPENLSEKEIEEMVRQHVRRALDEVIPIEPHEYIPVQMKGKTISIIDSSKIELTE